MGKELKSLVKDTALYGISSIVGRFLNYLLVPLYTIKITAESGGYGVVTNVYAYTALLLVLSNCFMTFAWYGHLKNLSGKPWIIAVLVSWGIALFEYLIQVPANRIGFQAMSLAQLKIMQEVITLSVFVPFAMFYMNESLRWNHLAAGICLVLAVVFVFAFGK